MTDAEYDERRDERWEWARAQALLALTTPLAGHAEGHANYGHDGQRLCTHHHDR